MLPYCVHTHTFFVRLRPPDGLRKGHPKQPQIYPHFVKLHLATKIEKYNEQENYGLRLIALHTQNVRRCVQGVNGYDAGRWQ